MFLFFFKYIHIQNELTHFIFSPTQTVGYQAINDAIIQGFQLTIGSSESAVTVFTANYEVSTPRPDPIYSWSWEFRRLICFREQRRWHPSLMVGSHVG